MSKRLGRFQCDPKPDEYDPIVTCYIAKEEEDDDTGDISYILDTANPVLLPLSEFVARVERGHEWFVTKQRQVKIAKKQEAEERKAEEVRKKAEEAATREVESK